MAALVSEEDVRRAGRSMGFDLLGFVDTRRLEEQVSQEYRPSRISRQLTMLIVVAKRKFSGLAVAQHRATQQFWGGRILKRMDESCLKFTVWLESRGAAALPLSSLNVDMGEGQGLDLCPAGQGSPLLKLAAVEAGLGTLGLNLMLLTPEYGPRVYLGGVLTDLELQSGQPLDEELCLGMEECGLCAATCPEDAIPRKSLRGAPLQQYRGLDTGACSRGSQALGPRRFREHLLDIFENRGAREQVWPLIRSRLTGALWQEMIMIKEGAFTACSVCVDVCPVGRDYRPTQQRMNADPLLVTRVLGTDTVEVVWSAGNPP